MKTAHLVSMIMIALLAACQQSDAPKADSNADVASTAVEQVVQPKVVEKTGPVAVVDEAVEKVKTVSKQIVAEKKEVRAVAVEEMAKKAVTTSVEVPKPVAEAAVVEAMLGNTGKGAKLAKGKCSACHYFDKDRKKTGPTLMGIYGRTPTIDGVPFAVWDAVALDGWLESPKAVKPKTKMAFKGIPEKEKRDDLIAYLKTL